MQPMSKGQPHGPLLAVLGLVALGAALRLAGIDQSLFGDENSTFTVATSAGSPGDVIHLIRADDQVVELTPPLSFILSWASAKIGDPTIWLRLPSLLAGILLIPAVYAVGRRTVGRSAALAAAALATLSPFLIFYSQEARSYLPAAFAVLVTTLLLLVALERRTWGWWAGYVAATIACLYLSYTTALPLGVQFGWVLWAHRDAWRPLLAGNAIAAVAFLPWLGEFFDDGRSPFNFLPSVHPLTFHNYTSDLTELTIGTPIAGRSAVPGTLGWILIAAGLAVAVAGLFARREPRPPEEGDRRRAFFLLGSMALACPIGMLLWSLAGTTIVDGRNLAPSLPYVLLLAGALLTASRMPVRAIATSLVFVGFALGALATLRDSNERPQFRDAGAYALSQIDPGDPIYAVENATYGGQDGPLERYLKPYVPDGDLREAADPAPGQLAAGSDRIAVISWHAGALAGVVDTPTEPADPPGYTEVARRTFPGFVDIEVRILAADQSS